MTIEQRILQLVKQADPINPLGYVRHILKDYSREKLDMSMKSFLEEDGPFPFCTVSDGDTSADLMIINGMAHPDQASLGEYVPAMKGTTAKEDVEKVLDYLKFDKTNVFYIDAVNYVAYNETKGVVQKRNAIEQEIEDMRPIITKAIEIVCPKAILLLGAQAANMFNKGFALKDSAGEMRHHGDVPMMSVYHPDFFRHMSGKRTQAEIDLLQQQFVSHIEKLLKKTKLI